MVGDVLEQPAGELTAGELAVRTGLPVRTIRYYVSIGLLPAPVRRGRSAFFGPSHTARLELVRDLQALGFSLAAIERSLARIPADRTPEDLALHRALLTPWEPEEGEELDRAELERRAGRELQPADLDRLQRLGALEPCGPDSTPRERQRFRAASPALLHLALRALDLDLPFASLVRAMSIIERHTTALAEELSALFGTSVLQGYRDAGRPASERERLLAMLQRLKPLTVQSVVNTFQLAVNRVIRQSALPPAAPARARSAGNPQERKIP